MTHLQAAPAAPSEPGHALVAFLASFVPTRLDLIVVLLLLGAFVTGFSWGYLRGSASTFAATFAALRPEQLARELVAIRTAGLASADDRAGLAAADSGTGAPADAAPARPRPVQSA